MMSSHVLRYMPHILKFNLRIFRRRLKDITFYGIRLKHDTRTRETTRIK